MDDSLHIPDEVIEALEGMAIRTSQGSYIKMEDVRRLAQKRTEAKAVERAEAPRPKTVEQARQLAKDFLREKGIGSGPPSPGRSLPASESQSSSRT
jgi:arginyl-tRNA synthetase